METFPAHVATLAMQFVSLSRDDAAFVPAIMSDVTDMAHLPCRVW